VADRDGGTNPNDPSISVVHRFNMQTGAPDGSVRAEKSNGFNDLAVAGDRTLYATQTGEFGQNPDRESWQVWKITSEGAASILIHGSPLFQPNGIALDPQGNIVVVNIGNADVLTFSPDGKLLRTEAAAQSGNDGLVSSSSR
jgi:DNA-binding beta-propeller fold protein YncE